MIRVARLAPYLLLTALGLAFSVAGFAQEATEIEVAADPAPALLDSRVTTTPDRARLVLDLTAPTEFAVYTLAEPDRVVAELRAETSSDDETTTPPGDGLVSEYTVTAAGEQRVRVELMLSAPAQIQQSYILEAFEDQPARLVIDVIPDSAENFAANVRPTEESENGEVVAELDGEAMVPGETAMAPPVSRPLVVIDPGHGGADSGASSGGGLEEKNIVLAFGLKLQSLLVDTGRFDVALTRDTDTFLTLADRVHLARLNQADLFISLHADSFDQPDVRGASVYTRGDLTIDVMDRVLAERENRADLVAGYSPPDDDVVVDVLVDLLSRETRRQSYIAAQALVEQLEPSIQLRRFPLRQADFFVLNAPDVPSVLIELGFLSNTDDSQNLATDAWLDRVAAALARGVAIYFDGQDR